MSRQVLIRADGNSRIGMGHIIRTSALAHALADLGLEPVYLRREAEAAGSFQACQVPSGLDLQGELTWMAAQVTARKPGLIIIDHYEYHQQALDQVAAWPGVVSLVIDDNNERIFNTDFMLNQNLYAPSLSVQGRARTLLGPDYALLRPEFSNIAPRPVKNRVENILVTMGAADPLATTLVLLDLLPHMPGFDSFLWHVLIGPKCETAEAIKDKAQSLPAVRVHHNPPDVKDLMVLCDISLSAAGSSIYELAACGVPSLLVVIAQNQQDLARTAEILGWSRNLGPAGQLELSRLCKVLTDILDDYEARLRMSRIAQKSVDGQGARRVARLLAEASGLV